jgi:hypothetical protein
MEQVRNLHSSSDIIKMIKYSVGWADYVARMGT